MSAQVKPTEPQVVDSNEFIDLLDYDFTGDSYTVERKRLFVQSYREQGSIYHAAIEARISRKTAYNWMDADLAFAQAVEDSKEDCYDQVETSVFRKAIAGDTISSIFYLKAHRPKFRDRLQVDIDQVDNEIRARLQAQQLPPATTTFVDTERNEDGYSAIAMPASTEQKEHD